MRFNQKPPFLMFFRLGLGFAAILYQRHWSEFLREKDPTRPGKKERPDNAPGRR
jgi:hypothetical protein